MPTANPAPSVERANLTTTLTRQIVALIQEGDLEPGARLPSAKALADRFAVAMPTLREALRHLQATGVIDIRHGAGIFVRQGHERLMLVNPAAAELDRHLALQVLDARILIEPALTERAAQRIEPGDLIRLEAIVERGRAALAAPAEIYLAANRDFHATIGRSSGNVVLAEVVESLIDLHSHELHVVDPGGVFAHRQDRDHPDHRRILAALAAHDAVLAGALMQAHLAAARSGVMAQLDREAAGERPESAG